MSPVACSACVRFKAEHRTLFFPSSDLPAYLRGAGRQGSVCPYFSVFCLGYQTATSIWSWQSCLQNKTAKRFTKRLAPAAEFASTAEIPIVPRLYIQAPILFYCPLSPLAWVMAPCPGVVPGAALCTWAHHATSDAWDNGHLMGSANGDPPFADCTPYFQ